MFENGDEENTYIKDNFEDITASHVREDLWDLDCGKCGVVRGFHVERRSVTNEVTRYGRQNQEDFYAPKTAYMRCPVCSAYKYLIYIVIDQDDYSNRKDYKIAELPSERFHDIEALPEKPATLRKAFKEAVKAMDANAYCAAASMLRRALQVITREIGGAKPSTLGKELENLSGKKVNGVTFSQDFSSNGYLVKEAGNQGAHPDDDPDLLDFTQQDAKDLYRIFMTIVADLFIAPKAAEEAVARFKSSRKIK